jgi:hypothetical protein
MRHAAVVCALEKGMRHAAVVCALEKGVRHCSSVCIGTGREILQNKLCQNEARDTAVVCARRRRA